MKMTSSFCISPMPAQRISNGMNADAGRYRANETKGSKNASIGLYAPIAIPSGTAMIAASRKPPMTRHTVMPTSNANPCTAKRAKPSRSIVSGSARNVFGTKPPNVAAAQAAKNSTKKKTPRPMRRRAEIGLSGCKMSLDELRVNERIEIRHRFDDARLEQNVGCVLAERLDFAGEEFLVRRLVLPAQVGRRLRKLLARLFHIRSHHVVALLRILLDHVHRFKIT